MADLLSSAQRLKIAAAIKDVADTFFKTSVQIFVQTGEFDRFSEGNGKTTQQYNMVGLVEYAGSQSEESINRFGQLSERQVMVTLHYPAMKALNLNEGISGSKIREETDYMIVDGNRYDIMVAIPDGPIDAENLLFILKGEKPITKS